MPIITFKRVTSKVELLEIELPEDGIHPNFIKHPEELAPLLKFGGRYRSGDSSVQEKVLRTETEYEVRDIMVIP